MRRSPLGGSAFASARAEIAIAFGRAAALAIGGVFAVQHGAGAVRIALLACACVHAIARTSLRERDELAWTDLAFAATLLAISGGPASAFAPYAQICTVAAGLSLGTTLGATGGALVAAASVPGLLTHGVVATPSEIFTWLILFPIVGMAGGVAGRIRQPENDDERIREHANKVLADLYRLARIAPLGLELRTVASEAVERARDEARCSAAVFVVADESGETAVASFGVEAPQEVATLAEHDGWIVAPVVHSGATLGRLLITPQGAAPGAAGKARAIAADSAIALDNALLFAKVRRLVIDDERARIAADLHDGVAQALAHLRFELDLIARTSASDPGEELKRLARVADRALTEVRATVVGLRTPLGDTLCSSLRSYIEDLRGAGRPAIEFRASVDGRIDPEAETEVFRIAQEAASNAIRHAGASRVMVCLDGDDDGLRLEVSDDGGGFGPPSADGTGLGLVAMRERAERIHARLSINERPGGGTSVVLECPRSLGGSA